MDLDLGIISESEKRLKKKLILDYIYSNLKHHNFWAYRYFFCEMLALMNVVGKVQAFCKIELGLKLVPNMHSIRLFVLFIEHLQMFRKHPDLQL
jgi:hypothetical protein